jgi:hypothetical protein
VRRIRPPDETWNVLEGQPLAISVFAFDPDNPGFRTQDPPAPRRRSRRPRDHGAHRQLSGQRPAGRRQLRRRDHGNGLDARLLQAGSYSITVTATDDGDGTGTPAVSQLVLPVIVNNANARPQIGDIGNAFVDQGGVIEIPVSASDVDGNPVELTFRPAALRHVYPARCVR